MPAARTPGPDCAYNHPQDVEDGTMCRTTSPRPEPTGATVGPQIGSGPQPADASIIDRIVHAAGWRELERWAGIALGPSSFSLGVCYGILASAAASAADLLGLLRMFVLAGLYERARQPHGWWDGLDAPDYLAARGAQWAFGPELKKAHDQCELLLRELKYTVSHPTEIFGSIGKQYSAKWKRFQGLASDLSFSSQFEAGKIAGGVLLDVISLIGAGEAVVKVVAKLPELAKLAEDFGGALKLGSRTGTRFAAEAGEANAVAVGAERMGASRPSSLEPEAPPPIEAPEIAALRNITVNGLKADRILPGTNGKVAVIGRSMQDVRPYTKDLGKRGYDTEIFDQDVVPKSAQREWDELTAGAQRVPDPEVPSTQMFRANQAWAQKLTEEGYTVVDIDNPKGLKDSVFYSMEQNEIFGESH